MVRGRAGLLATDDEATTRGRSPSRSRRGCPTRASAAGSRPPCLALLAVEPAPPGGRESLFAAWRTYFERIGSRWHGRHPPLRGPALGRPGAARFHRPPARVVDRRADPHRDPGPPGAPRATSGVGCGSAELRGAPSRSAVRRRGRGAARRARQRASRPGRRRRSSGERTASRSTRSRPSGCWSPTSGSPSATGSYVPVGDLTELAVPETLHALIAARLDALDPTDRALLQNAAVLGQSFTPTGLAAVAAADPAELEPRLRGLVRREILVQQVDPRSPERGQYSFVQALVREVAYSTLAKRDRRDRHLAAARHFESLGEDELVGALAAHYLAAFEASAPGPEADAVGGQARIALRAAAERAAALGSHEQAVTFLDQALQVTTDPGEQADLLVRTGEAASAAGPAHAGPGAPARGDRAETRGVGDRPGAAAATAALGRATARGVPGRSRRSRSSSPARSNSRTSPNRLRASRFAPSSRERTSSTATRSRPIRRRRQRPRRAPSAKTSSP